MTLCSACPQCGADISATATITISEPSPVSLTTHSLRTVGAGFTSAGVKSLSFINDGNGLAYVGRDSEGNLVSLLANSSIHFSYVSPTVTYGAIEYSAVGTSLRIDWTT